MSDVLKHPGECTEAEIQSFFELLMTGNEVRRETAITGIKRAELLAFHYEKDILAGIAAIKRPTNNYRNSVFSKAKTDEQATKYSLELGYAVTLEAYRGRGICSNLVKELMKVCSEHVYSTTKDDGMQTTLEHNGFEKTGKPYKGTLRGKNYFLQLFVR